jgi:hypothetical protein
MKALEALIVSTRQAPDAELLKQAKKILAVNYHDILRGHLAAKKAALDRGDTKKVASVVFEWEVASWAWVLLTTFVAGNVVKQYFNDEEVDQGRALAATLTRGLCAQGDDQAKCANPR